MRDDRRAARSARRGRTRPARAACAAPGCGPKTGPVTVRVTVGRVGSRHRPHPTSRRGGVVPRRRRVPRQRAAIPYAALPAGLRAAGRVRRRRADRAGRVRRRHPPASRARGPAGRRAPRRAGRRAELPPRPVPSDEEREAFVLEAERHRARLPGADPAAVLGGAGPVPRRPARPAAARLRAAGVAGRAPRPTTPAGARPRSASALRILTATWSVPIHWFVPFAPADRERRRLTARRRGACCTAPGCRRPGGGSAAGAAHAAALARRARRTSRSSRTLGRWLEDFHPRSWLELDYGGLARLLGPEGLAPDTSVGRRRGLARRARGRRRGRRGRHVPRPSSDRWAAVRALEHAN